MTTRYQCKGCQLVFEGFDPVRFGDFPELVFPLCPNNQLTQLDPTLSLDAKAVALEELEQAHPVGLAVVVQPQVETKKPVPSAWGQPRVHKAATEEEKQTFERERALAELQRQRDKAEMDADSEARRLVQKIQLAITNKQGTPKGLTGDIEYGSKANGAQTQASANIIGRASVLWLALGADYSFRAPAWKKQWKQYQANFERLVVSGQPGKGKHNFHVVRV